MTETGKLTSIPTALLTAELEARSSDGIRISFVGKSNARTLARKVRPRVQRVVKKYCVGSSEDQSHSLVIEGDNLQAMATLYGEHGQVDLIVTDPPYNTGKDFRYNDKWEEDPNDQSLGEWVSADDGARHTKWMRFMWPRLQMMKAMLKPSGVLAVCIDHRELFRLGQMLDELFGEANRLAIINWQRAATRRNDKGGAEGGAGGVSVATEYVLVYARDKERARTGLEPRGEDEDYSNPDGDPDGDWLGVDVFAPGAATHQGMLYGAQSPFTGVLHYPPGSKCWSQEKAWVKAQLERWGSRYVEVQLDDARPPALLLEGSPDPRDVDLSEHEIVVAAREKAVVAQTGVWPQMYFLKNGYGRPRKKTHLSQVKQGLVPTTYWSNDTYEIPLELEGASWAHGESGTSEIGFRELSAVVGADHGFETVKPLKLMEKVIQLWCRPDGLVLDPFAGSGTTGHAVLRMNSAEGVDRRFILVEQGRPDNGDSYARSLLADRLGRAISGKWKGLKKERRAEPLGGGFRFVRLDKTVDADTLLSMEREEMVDTIIASHFDSARQRRELITVAADEGFQHLAAINPQREGFFLIWGGADAANDLSEEIYEEIAEEAQRAGLERRYHVYARRDLYQTKNVAFYQIPDRILMDFGLDLRGEPYYADDTE